MKADKPWDKNLQILLASILIFNVVPHVAVVPPWISALCLGCVVWKLLYLTRGVPLPRRWLLAFATVASAVGVFFSYGTILGQVAASALLVTMASLKLLETNRYRDAMLVIFTSYFLLMAHLLESQSLLSTLYMVADLVIISLLMYQIHRRDRRRSIRSYRPAMKLIGATLPVWIFLFLAFPRFSTTLWNMQTRTAGTGFSEELDPGSIEKLVDSDDPAFRVEFAGGRHPRPEKLYWRGAILSESDGLKWSKSKEPFALQDRIQNPEGRQSTTKYEVFIEPGYERWLFVLDFPTEIDSLDARFGQQIRKYPGFIYNLNLPLRSRNSYMGTSILEAPSQFLTAEQRAKFLALPDKLDDRVKELANRLKAEADLGAQALVLDPAERYSSFVMRWFSDTGFHYTKTPGALQAQDGAGQLSEFLFQSKRGFCEHYSASFATLMRMMGVPARVVVGFQGGVANEFGGYWLVRKLDAHAWTEVWHDTRQGNGQGQWVRVDPTEAVAPLRLQLGGDFNRLAPETLIGGFNQDEIRRRLNAGLSGTIARIRAAWDMVQMSWNTFLLRYDLEYQLELLARVGVERGAPLVLAIISVCGLLVFAFGLTWALRRQARKEDPLLAEWRRFCLALERVGLTRYQNEGPLSFAERAGQARPDKAHEIRMLADQYAQLRYGPEGETLASSQLKRFRQSVRRFSIKASSR